MLDLGHGLGVGQNGGLDGCCFTHGLHLCHRFTTGLLNRHLRLIFDPSQEKGQIAPMSQKLAEAASAAQACLVIVLFPVGAGQPLIFGLPVCQNAVDFDLIKTAAPRHGILIGQDMALGPQAAGVAL